MTRPPDAGDFEATRPPGEAGFHRHTDMDPVQALAEMQRENDYMAREIARLGGLVLTQQEIDYLRHRKEQDERAAWALQMIREYAPWLIGLIGGLGTLAYWFLTHELRIGPKP